jgi:hypothetical protein
VWSVVWSVRGDPSASVDAEVAAAALASAAVKKRRGFTKD